MVDGLKWEALSGASFFHPARDAASCNGMSGTAVMWQYFSQPRAADLR
jgi:hypothetical protein